VRARLRILLQTSLTQSELYLIIIETSQVF
jgi:hypothetical protein